MKTFRIPLAALPLAPMVALAGWREAFSSTDQTNQSLAPDGLIAVGTSIQARKALLEWRVRDGQSLRGRIFHDEKHSIGVSQKKHLARAKSEGTGARIFARIHVTKTKCDQMRPVGLTPSRHQEDTTGPHGLALPVSADRPGRW